MLMETQRDHSMLTFESTALMGAVPITDKLVVCAPIKCHPERALGSSNLQGLPFTKVKHQVATLDAQPSIPDNNGIMILVTGALLVRGYSRWWWCSLGRRANVSFQVDEEQRPMNYSQSFLLQPDGQSYYIYNDIFKLVYG